MKLGHKLFPVAARQIHFVEEQKGRHAVPFQQPPQGQGVSLDSVGAADDQHGAVQNGHGSLGLRGKVHMSRGVHQGDFPAFRFQPSLLGENGNAPAAL